MYIFLLSEMLITPRHAMHSDHYMPMPWGEGQCQWVFRVILIIDQKVCSHNFFYIFINHIVCVDATCTYFVLALCPKTHICPRLGLYFNLKLV